VTLVVACLLPPPIVSQLRAKVVADVMGEVLAAPEVLVLEEFLAVKSA
jgi:hypothetical protein